MLLDPFRTLRSRFGLESRPLPGTDSWEPSEDDRLESWKEIAGYLKRDVSTVQRWEKREGLPVHRQAHQKLGTFYAYKHELDSWRLARAPLAERRSAASGSEFWKFPAPRLLLAVLFSAALFGAVALLRFPLMKQKSSGPLKVAPFTSYPGDEDCLHRHRFPRVDRTLRHLRNAASKTNLSS